MANWTPVITNDGDKELNGLLACETLSFVEARGCTGKVPEAALTAQTSLPGWTHKATITEVKRNEEGVTVKLRFGAADTAYAMHRIGLWVKVGDGQPVMAAIYQHQADGGVAIPSKEENPNFSYVYYAGLAIKNGKLVALTIDPIAQQGLANDAAASAVAAAGSAAAAENAKLASVAAKEDAQESMAAAQEAEENVLGAQAALHTRRRVRIGTATDVELLMPGDELIIVDDSSVTHTTDYQDLLLEAQKAAAGTTNNLETMAVLSVVNATNLRRTADGLLWTTDTLANFREKLTAFAAAAVAGGYVTTDGQCIATWAQAQAWLLEGTLFSPIDAEAKDYTWRKAAPKTEYDAIKERLGSIEAQLGQGAGTINTLITGGTR